MLRGKVLLTDHPWPDAGIERDILAGAGLELTELPAGADPAKSRSLSADVDGILTCWAPVPRAMIESSPSLRVVSRMGVGLDNIDLAAAAARGIVVTNVPDYCVEEVSDHVVAFVHAWARGTIWYDRLVREGGWAPGRYPLRKVSSLTVGVIGLGRIGQRAAAKLRALGCRVLGSDPAAPVAVAGVEIVPQADLLTEAEVVTIHVPLLPGTHHLVDGTFLDTMRPGSLLINVSRGGLVDTAALTSTLRDGRLSAAALDVLESEPEVPPALRELPNVFLTPHVAFLSDTSIVELRRRSTEEVVAVLSGQAPRNPVPLPAPPAS